MTSYNTTRTLTFEKRDSTGTINGYSLDDMNIYKVTAGYDIFKSIYRNYKNLSNDNVKKKIKNFMLVLQRNLVIQNDVFENFNNYLPPLLMNELEDGSVVIEWIYSNFRVVFSFEVNDSESFAMLLTSKEYSDLNITYSLNKDSVNDTVKSLLSFIVSNT